MVSDDERREVSENLRSLAYGRFIQYKEQFFLPQELPGVKITSKD